MCCIAVTVREAAVESPFEIESRRQRLLGCVAESDWSDAEMLKRLAPSDGSLRFMKAALFTPLVLASTACWVVPSGLLRLGTKDPGVRIAGLTSCASDASEALTIDPSKQLTVLVHGCRFSRGGFRTLAQVFEAHGQQTVCFNYNDRDLLETSARQLRVALESLETLLSPGLLTLVGHSQGGLVARRALVDEGGSSHPVHAGFQYRLVTVSSPFAGIASSRDCGRVWLHVLSLGVTVVICQVIAGDNWHEIFPGSDFMVHPGTLVSSVAEHVEVVTDERGACRRQSTDGACAESDFVFALQEQTNSAVDSDPRVVHAQVQAGHVEIVGEQGTPPAKLLEVLQSQRILTALSPERSKEVAALVDRIYRVSRE